MQLPSLAKRIPVANAVDKRPWRNIPAEVSYEEITGFEFHVKDGLSKSNKGLLDTLEVAYRDYS